MSDGRGDRDETGATPPPADGSASSPGDRLRAALSGLRPTRRGALVVAVALAAFAMGSVFAGRGLNAVVMPAVTLLGLGALAVLRAPAPTVTRRCPTRGHEGDAVDVQLDVEGDRTVVTRITDLLPAGLDGDGSFETLTDGRTLRYELALAARGVHQLGPVGVEFRDLLGLWRRRLVVEDVQELTVYPPVHTIHESAGLLSGYVGLTEHREQFDSIREYEPGDGLRDINWKASAKRPGELVVTEYAGEGAQNRVTIGVTAASGRDDEVAAAAASVAVHFLENGIAVGLLTPAEEVGPGTGESQRRRLLEVLARFEGGRAAPRDVDDDADVRVAADGIGPVTVRLPEHSHRFADVRDQRREVA